MSCNGCRVLRKGCSEHCILRPCLQWIASAESQGYATVFLAKFFGRAGLMSFISAVPESQRPALFQSLLFEAAGRTVNPVNGAVGLLWTGNWNACQAAVDTILRGGSLRPMPETHSQELQPATPTSDGASEDAVADRIWKLPESCIPNYHSRFSSSRSRASPKKKKSVCVEADPACVGVFPGANKASDTLLSEEDSVTTTFTNSNNFISCYDKNGSKNRYGSGGDSTLLNLFT